ncbi:hypothetical protein NHU_01438 [Rhodovulum sulfidophilum]|uniref:DUF177 domain-containing protein n=1 Tax=Rhodovulum sulfidophilum TaxID=35806 RepID=A0A0D6B0P5_RHOSU|nr:hypothetical protein NHU_01438 [Rhodovulum sulfidophilum]
MANTPEPPRKPTMTAPRSLRLAGRRGREPLDFVLAPDPEERAALAGRLGITSLKKLRFAGELRPEGQADWRLEASLGATVVQPCVVTLAPVSTRIDTDVLRLYRADMPARPEAEEIEMPEDENEEPLPDRLDLALVMEEALALALPLYPRAEGADLGEAVFAAPGMAPMQDAELKPFAALARLRPSRDDAEGGGTPE